MKAKTRSDLYVYLGNSLRELDFMHRTHLANRNLIKAFDVERIRINIRSAMKVLEEVGEFDKEIPEYN